MYTYCTYHHYRAARSKSSCCGARLERRNDGKLYCSECGSYQGS